MYLKLFLIFSFIFFASCSSTRPVTAQKKYEVSTSLVEQYRSQSMQAFRIGELVLNNQRGFRGPRSPLVVINVENLFYQKGIDPLADSSSAISEIGGLGIDWDFAPGSLGLLQKLKDQNIATILYCTLSIKCESLKDLLNITGSLASKWKFYTIAKTDDFQKISRRVETSKVILFLSHDIFPNEAFSRESTSQLKRAWVILPASKIQRQVF
ncbi:MAG: hypothetical protein GY909_13010 [Oligoflexia bacterium]|nr:hypothetical protein [Oligoflexia bacterium]